MIARHVLFHVTVRLRTGAVARPSCTNAGVRGVEVLGNCKYFRIVRNAVRHLLYRGYVTRVALRVDARRLFSLRPPEEAMTGRLGLFPELLLPLAHGDLYDAVSTPRVDKCFAECVVTKRPRGTLWQLKRIELCHLSPMAGRY